MPQVSESENPRFIYGFVVLINVFRAADEEFITAWKGLWHHKDMLRSAEDMDPPGSLQSQELDETQRVDILVTQQWLRGLVWQMYISHNPSEEKNIWHSTLDGRLRARLGRRYPFGVLRHLLGIISTAHRKPLESHGIGMVLQPLPHAPCCISSCSHIRWPMDPLYFFSFLGYRC